MPRVGRFSIAAIDDLFRQIRYAPVSARRRQMDAAEQLIGDIDPQRNYPEDFIIFRITGYRPDERGPAATLVGEALLPDLLRFVQRLSLELSIPPTYRDRLAVPLSDVAQRLRVTQKTLQRYRRRGLVCHYVDFGDQTPRLACFEDALDAFCAQHQSTIAGAARFSRLGADEIERLVGAARALHAETGQSLNEIAAILAERAERAHETVRLVLQRHDRRSDEPVFNTVPPLDDRAIRLIERAWRFGIGSGVLCRRFRRTTATIQRALLRRRADRLRQLPLQVRPLPLFEHPEAEAVILSVAEATNDLDDLPPDRDALSLIAWAREAPTVPEDAENQLLAAFNYLKWRVACEREALPAWPAMHAIDSIETRLRWATLLHRRLVGFGLPIAVRTVERFLHRPLDEHPSEQIVMLLQAAVQNLGQTVDRLDPGRGHRMDRRIAQDIDRTLAQLELLRAPERAAARHGGGPIALGEPIRALSMAPWLALPSRWCAHVDDLAADAATFIRQVHGLGGAPPQTLRQLAEAVGTTPAAVSRRLRRIELNLLQLARESDGRDAKGNRSPEN